MKPLLFILTFVVVLGVLGASMYISYTNNYEKTTNLYEAQLDYNRAVFDDTWKIISQEAQVADKYSEEFRKNFVTIMESRNYGGEMFKWIQEHNPNFDSNMYSRIQNDIKALRLRFTENQRRLISIHRELKNLKTLFPSRIFLSSATLPNLTVITSDRTEEVFSTERENEVTVFN